MNKVKKYSCSSLLKKKSCNGKTIRVESLDAGTAERINRSISATVRQHLVKQQQTRTCQISVIVFKKAR